MAARTSPPIALTQNALRPDKGGSTGRLINVRTNFFAIKKVAASPLQHLFSRRLSFSYFPQQRITRGYCPPLLYATIIAPGRHHLPLRCGHHPRDPCRQGPSGNCLVLLQCVKKSQAKTHIRKRAYWTRGCDAVKIMRTMHIHTCTRKLRGYKNHGYP